MNARVGKVINANLSANGGVLSRTSNSVLADATFVLLEIAISHSLVSIRESEASSLCYQQVNKGDRIGALFLLVYYWPISEPEYSVQCLCVECQL